VAQSEQHFGEKLEGRLEGFLYHSRWLLAPFYVGLVISVVALGFAFLEELVVLFVDLMHEVWDIFPDSHSATESSPGEKPGISPDKAILGVLTLIDLSLAGNLLLIIIFSGYENFVSRIDTGSSKDRPRWMGNIDFAGLKMRLISSIIAISAISLLRVFLQLIQANEPGQVNLQVDRIRWLVITHGVFVLSGTMFAVMDWIGARTERTRKEDGADTMPVATSIEVRARPRDKVMA
jgi:uncharacterized protein (TIGR00645 family)